MVNRIEAIATELVYHHMQKGGDCLCGYRYRPGESIHIHRAERADLAIHLNEAGVSLDDLHEAVTAASSLLTSGR